MPNSQNTFSYNENSFSITFQAFYYDNPKKIKYQYKIDNLAWLQSPSHEIQFASMVNPAITLFGLERDCRMVNNWGAPLKSVEITILPPFYRTWWFYLVSRFIAYFYSLSLLKDNYRKLRLKQEEKTKTQRKLVELQQKALASNLNPHFVFNSLNAIQHFINSKSPGEANEYLAKFARLMRMHLNMAEKNSILLFEEIQRLEYYLNLEQMRFGDKMEWTVSLIPKLMHITWKFQT